MCPVVAAIGVIGTEWRLAIIHRLLEGPQRFSELLRSNPHLNAKTLSATLKFLQGAGVVQRTVVSTQPFVVTYSLTEMGFGLAPAAKELRDWGLRWLRPRSAVDAVHTPAVSHDIEPALPAPTTTEMPPTRVHVPGAIAAPSSPPAPVHRETASRRSVSRPPPSRFK
ncbi:MAG: helix-turn-helix transcriptional regulator [Thermoplasmata archaeon]|nr:helix-turn-helix transcriptional regulator [Thermoplasmata archaeon]MCI4340860.1 helix-turn-helix transcriptional regulator [Thermoplasmata archaeon]